MEALRPLHSNQALKEQIRQAVDIVDLIGRHVALRRAGSTYKGLCPFHQEKTPSFTVHPTNQFFKCHGWGVGGDVFSFVQRWEKVEFREALEMLADQVGIPLTPATGVTPTGPTRSELARITGWAAQTFRRWLLDASIGSAAREYLTARGIDDRFAERFRLGYAPDRFDAIEPAAREAGIVRGLLHKCGLLRQGSRGGSYDTFRHRLMFPIVDTMDRVIGFGGRTLGDDPAKYMNSPESLLFDKGRSLYGLNQARAAMVSRGRAVVVEGYTDCIMAHQFGIEETVATMGTALTEAHVALLKRHADCVILVFDSDEAGQRAADRALTATLTQQLQVRIARVPEGKDPCDDLQSHGAEAFESVLSGSFDAAEYIWRQMVRENGRTASGRQRRDAVEAFLDRVATAAASGAIDAIGRGFLVNQAAKVLALPADEVQRELNHRQQRKTRRHVAASATHTPTTVEADPPPTPKGDASLSPDDPKQAALIEILEVVLNDAHWYANVESWLRPELFAQPGLRNVAGAVVELIQSTQTCAMPTLLGRFHDPNDTDIALTLQLRGQEKGNFAAQVEGALRRLEMLEQRARIQVMAREAAQGGNPANSADTNERLLRLTQEGRHVRSFHPRSLLPSQPRAGADT